MSVFARHQKRGLSRPALLGGSIMKLVIATMIVSCAGFFGCAELQADLAFNPKGDLFVLSRRDEIFKYTADGTKNTFATLSKEPISLAFDSAGNLFVGDSAGSIFRFSPDGKKSTFITGLKEAGPLACDAAGNLFVADEAESLVLKFAPDRKKSTVATGVRADEMVLDPAGNLFVPTRASKEILRITSGGVKTTFATEIEYADTMAVDSSGNLFVYASPGTIFKITADGRKSAFVTNLVVSIPFSACDSSGSLFFGEPNEDSIMEFTPDGKEREFDEVPGPAHMAFDKAGNLFVQGSFAIYKFDSAGSKSTFASDWLSPDKRWEYQCSDDGERATIVKAGTNQVVQDLSDAPSNSGREAEVVWAPDSKRFAVNYREGRSFVTALYQVKGSEWVALRSPVEATLPIVEKSKSKDTHEPGLDSWAVEKWIDSNTALMSAELHNSYSRFIFTLKFDAAGNWKIIHQTNEKAE
jgi:sugar lactone lactonase YvrE